MNCEHAGREIVSQLDTAFASWVCVTDELPPEGVPVLLFANGVVQEETYRLYSASNGECDYNYWQRDDLDEAPVIDDRQQWMHLPKPPNKGNVPPA